MAQTFTCKNCGIIFRGKASKKPQHCSMECKRESGTKNRQRTCPQCNETFVVDNIAKNGKYCSRECSGKAQQKQQERACEWCKTPFYVNPSSRRKHCSHKCYFASMPGRTRPTMLGKPSWNKGLSAETNQRIALTAALRSGANHHNWRGGRFKYYGPDWSRQSKRARKRDGYKCRHCGISQKKLGRKLDVHHIVPFRTFRYIRNKNENHLLANHLDNLISLCPSCHHLAEYKRIPIQPNLLSV